MNKLSKLGIIGGAALLAAVPHLLITELATAMAHTTAVTAIRATTPPHLTTRGLFRLWVALLSVGRLRPQG
jgi:hypothetical protein